MAGRVLEVGGLKVRALDDGTFITDAGSLLGGSRRARIKGAMHPVLVESGGDLILLDAGFGPEVPESLQDHYELRREHSLLDAISATGRSADEVTHVVLSHLDADHVGWALRSQSFPNATVYVQQDAFEEARRSPEGEGRREAVPEVERGIKEGWCKLLEGDGEVADGVRVEVRAGHSAGHQIVWIGSGDDVALYTADLAPARMWLDPDLISGADTDPEAARENRIEVLTRAAGRGMPVILYHEPGEPLVRVERAGEKFRAVSLE
jgi:glyoxylase-like metal-dependent hydrolase (beta-lactamase superfamily II)